MKTQVGTIAREWRLFHRDTGDMWGSVMCTLFDIADTLYLRGDGPPDSWEYRPGACGPEAPECVPWEEDTPSEVIEEFGEVLIYIRDRLEGDGRDY